MGETNEEDSSYSFGSFAFGLSAVQDNGKQCNNYVTADRNNFWSLLDLRVPKEQEDFVLLSVC